MAQLVRVEVCGYSLRSGQKATRVGDPLGLAQALSACV